ncbi:MAG: hypothetical protein GQ469_08880 [Methanosarcinales archaeon]|nr:hypothetical protein [Methanosarcinales archaeon]
MFNTRLLLIAIVIILIPQTVSALTIHGTVYEWSTFEPLDNALVEVNSTPTQFRVAASGVYSFNLPPGDYLIKTSYYQNDTLVYYGEDTLTVTDYEGNYVFDILMFPLQEEAEEFPDVDIGNVTYDVEDNILPGFDLTYTAVALLILMIMVAAAYYYYKKRDGLEEESVPTELIESTDPTKSAGQAESSEAVPGVHNEDDHPDDREPAPDIDKLPEDLKEIIDILESLGGRMTQKDLRTRLNCSEAKVSLMITDLEDRGLVHKVKKGRGNIILLRSME